MLKKRVIVTPLALSLSATIFSGLIHHNAATAVTGVHAGVDNYTNARPFRTEINAFAQSGPAFDLYIQALMTFQNQSGDTGYFEIAGQDLPYASYRKSSAESDNGQESMDIRSTPGKGPTLCPEPQRRSDIAPISQHYFPSGTDHT